MLNQNPTIAGRGMRGAGAVKMYRWTGKFRKKWKRLTFIQVPSMGERLCWLL